MNLPKNLLSRLDFAMCHEVNTQKVLILLPWFKKGSGTFAGTARRVLCTKVPDLFEPCPNVGQRRLLRKQYYELSL